MARKACSRCLKEFPKVGDSTNYSGFERDEWPLRNHAVQYNQAYQTLKANTKEAKKNLEKTFGLRYSVFHKLACYDSVRFSTIDTMHNLFLGSSKHVMNTWKENELITNHHFATMHERIGKINVPMDVGRIPHKIESSMSKLTADEWKNWTCIYSLFVLHDILPREHI